MYISVSYNCDYRLCMESPRMIYKPTEHIGDTGKADRLSERFLEMFTILEMLTILVIMLILYYSYVLINKILLRGVQRPKNAPKFYPSYTTYGPYQFFVNPIPFVKRTRKELEVSSFSINFFSGYVTVVYGKEDVEKIVSAPPEILSFTHGYGPIIEGGFGRDILNDIRFHSQVNLLTKNLSKKKIESYLVPSRDLIRDLLKERTPKSGSEFDVQTLLLDGSLRIAARNFLGGDFVKILNRYPFREAARNFDMKYQILKRIIPPFLRTGKPTSYERDVLNLLKSVDKSKGIDSSDDVLTEVAKRREDPDIDEIDPKNNNPVACDDRVMLNLITFFVFGLTLNSYNMEAYFTREIADNEKTWASLRAEQEKVDKQFGEEIINQQKLDAMVELEELLTISMRKHCFPFLIRTAEVDFPLSDGVTVVPKGDLIFFSPRQEHDNGVNLTFGKGKHACPAMDYAMLIMKTIMSEIIKRLKTISIVRAPPPKDDFLITFPIQPEIIVKYTLAC